MKKNVLKTAIFMEFVAAMVLSICVVFGCSFSDRKDADKQVVVEDTRSEAVTEFEEITISFSEEIYDEGCKEPHAIA